MASNAPLTDPGPLRPILEIEANPQIDSPLFQRIPPEVRARIWTFTLSNTADTTDPSKRYRNATPYTRPGFTAPLRTHTALLETCRAALQEAWFMPASCHEHAEWVASAKHTPPGRKQPKTDGPQAYDRQLPREGKVGGLRFFVRVQYLELLMFFRALWRMKPMNPRRFTLTLRHTDWTGWQKDEPLQLVGSWAVSLGERLPASVKEVYFELETSARRADEARELAAQMLEKWFLVRQDYQRMYPDRVEESRWRGTSAWNGRRWKREEVAPRVMEYVVYAVRFRAEEDMSANERARISKVARTNSRTKRLCECRLQLELPGLEAPEDPGVSSSCAKSMPTPAPMWTQLPRVVMEGESPDRHPDDESSTDNAEEEENDCHCMTPRLRIPQPVQQPPPMVLEAFHPDFPDHEGHVQIPLPWESGVDDDL